MKKFILFVSLIFLSLVALGQDYKSNSTHIFPDINSPRYREVKKTVIIRISPTELVLSKPESVLFIKILGYHQTVRNGEFNLITYKGLLKGSPVLVGYMYDDKHTLLNVGIYEEGVLVVFLIDYSDRL